MNFKVQVRRAAELDVAEAQVWYETQRSGLGNEFHSEISQIFTILTETPLIYPILHRDVRRALVHRFPYLVWYRVVGDNDEHAPVDQSPSKQDICIQSFSWNLKDKQMRGGPRKSVRL